MSGAWNLPLRRVPANKTKDTSVVWNNVSLCYEQKLFGQVTSMCYNNAGTMLGSTSTNQVALLRIPQTDGVAVNEQTERKNFSLRFRDDDKLYIQAVDQRVVVKSCETAFERQFLGHKREVRSALFIGKQNFVSGSDDTTIKLWDLLGENELATGSAHTDYVRSLETYNSGAFFSGSYDHTIKLWDPRVGLAAPLNTSGGDLTAAVEALLFIPNEEILACACGDSLFLFDMRKGLSVPLSQGSFHTKSVVALAYSQEYKTLFTGSLDCRIKMFSFDGGELSCVSSKKFDNPVTTVAVHPESREFAVGSAVGELKVFKLKVTEEKPDDENLLGLTEKKMTPKEALDEKMHGVQHQLATYQYGKAMKTALYSRFPEVIVSALEEMVRRGVLHIALNNQNDRTIARVLRFATEYIDKPQFTDTMCVVLNTIFDIYGAVVGRSVFFHREMLNAQKKIGMSLASIRRMEKTMSIMELIVNN